MYDDSLPSRWSRREQDWRAALLIRARRPANPDFFSPRRQDAGSEMERLAVEIAPAVAVSVAAANAQTWPLPQIAPSAVLVAGRRHACHDIGAVARSAPESDTIAVGQWDTHSAVEPVSPNDHPPNDDLRSLATDITPNPRTARLVNQLASAQRANSTPSLSVSDVANPFDEVRTA